MNKPITTFIMIGALLSGSPPAQAETPKALFVQNCSSCHNSDASGIEGLAPPLLNADLWSRLGEQAPLYLMAVMTGGMSGKLHVNGQDYIGMVMPPVMIGHEEKAAIAGHVLALNGLSPALTIRAADMPTLTHQDLRAMRNSSNAAALALQQ